MKYIQVLDPIQVVIDGQNWETPWSFHRFLTKTVFCDATIGTAYSALNACDIVDKLFKNEIVGTWVGVEDAHWELLNTAIREPKNTNNPEIVRQFLPFMKAILNGKTEEAYNAEILNEKTK